MDKKKLTGLMKELDKAKDEAVGCSEVMSEMIARAKEEHHLHPAAFRAAWRLARMPSEKRNDFLRAFDEYRMKLGLGDEPDMLDEAAE